MAREMAVSGTHARLMDVLSETQNLGEGRRVLDIGAGAGSFSARLKDAGLSVSACDVVPDNFDLPGVDFRACEASGALPFADASFDLAVAVEVMEHIDDHDRFFSEVTRVLKPGGVFMMTTPNILSLKSRLRFLFTGCYYSFGLLVPGEKDPVHQHISPFTLNRYTWMLSQHGLEVCHVTTDRKQTSSVFLSFLVPGIALRLPSSEPARSLARAQNSRVTLLGRKLIVLARKGDSVDQS